MEGSSISSLLVRFSFLSFYLLTPSSFILSKAFCAGVFMLVERSKRVLVGPEDDHDRGWYSRFVAFPTRELVGKENMTIPER